MCCSTSPGSSVAFHCSQSIPSAHLLHCTHLTSCCCAQVFEALADAQRKLGFRHWDLRLSNVMQHTPLQHTSSLAPAALEASSTEPSRAPRLQYKVIDFGHGNLYDGQLRPYDKQQAW